MPDKIGGDIAVTSSPVVRTTAAAAFFDLDNTVMQGASLYYFARGLAARKYFTTGDLLKFGWSQLKFRLFAHEDAGDISEAREAALAFIAGWKVEDVRRLSEEIFDELIAERIWAGTRALAEQHIAHGDRVWLVTAAPVELGEVIARRLGLTGALGTVAEIRDGVYTGRLVGDMLHGPAKETAVRALAAAEGIDLADCYAYSDSVNDLPMLGAVGHPTAVNPDSSLRRHARARGWQIRDFRTTRKAAKVAVPATLAAGVLAGAVTAGLAIRNRNKD
ncbi:HAD family hydrolase [Hamadaea tsunoensis]|uniref:HAD family hydrolase n=1 Tax=Hamadaea tsunoensis TaxID=53368 RepID=UPI00389907AD